MTALITTPEIVLPEFETQAEAEAATLAFNKKADLLRHDLLDLFERNAHGKLDFTSFEAYCAERLNINMDKQALYHQREWAKIERTIAVNSPASSTVVLLDSGSSIVKVPRDEALQLAKLPHANLQRIAWERYEGIKEAGVRLPGEYLRGLKNIVSQLLPPKEDAPVAPPPPTAFEQAQATAPPAPTASTPAAKSAPLAKPDAPKVSAPTLVTSFTPPADPDPDEEFAAKPTEDAPLDFEDAAEALQTALTWVENEEIDGGRKQAQLIACSLVEIARWIEQEAK